MLSDPKVLTRKTVDGSAGLAPPDSFLLTRLIVGGIGIRMAAFCPAQRTMCFGRVLFRIRKIVPAELNRPMLRCRKSGDQHATERLAAAPAGTNVQ